MGDRKRFFFAWLLSAISFCAGISNAFRWPLAIPAGLLIVLLSLSPSTETKGGEGG